jgi:hypothetical protein
MSLGKRKHKNEHAGAKNGGGHWGTRAEAKGASKKLRRSGSKDIIQSELALVAHKKNKTQSKKQEQS